MRAKRLEELRPSDTNDYDYYDMHLYDTHARLRLPPSFPVVHVFASEAMLGLCYEILSLTRLSL
jgi:hypothetical protein